MQTVLESKGVQVVIDSEGPLTIIGEKINPSRNPRLTAALQAGEYSYVRDLAKRQVEAGADVLDVNVAQAGLAERELLPIIVGEVTDAVAVPLALDSTDPSAFRSALEVVHSKCIVNSVDGRREVLEQTLPLVAEHGVAVIGLTMDERGIPSDVGGRLRVAQAILDSAARAGVPSEDVLIDPLALSIATSEGSAMVVLEAIRSIRREFGVNVVLGASNVSFGLPDRHVLNGAFIALAAWAGASAVIADPISMTSAVRAIDLLLGRDPAAARFLRHFRGSRLRGSRPG